LASGLPASHCDTCVNTQLLFVIALLGGANVVAIERETRFRREFLSAGPHTELRAWDVLLVDVPRSGVTGAALAEMRSKFGLEELPLQGAYFTDQSQEVGMAEVILPPDSEMVGKNLLQLPVSSPVNTLVMGPGQYRFFDFVKVGVPFTVLVMIISVLLVRWRFPLH
jgi:hypothetical protein